jgi:hypothetical protein
MMRLKTCHLYDDEDQRRRLGEGTSRWSVMLHLVGGHHIRQWKEVPRKAQPAIVRRRGGGGDARDDGVLYFTRTTCGHVRHRAAFMRLYAA